MVMWGTQPKFLAAYHTSWTTEGNIAPLVSAVNSWPLTLRKPSNLHLYSPIKPSCPLHRSHLPVHSWWNLFREVEACGPMFRTQYCDTGNQCVSGREALRPQGFDRKRHSTPKGHHALQLSMRKPQPEANSQLHCTCVPRAAESTDGGKAQCRHWKL